MFIVFNSCAVPIALAIILPIFAIIGGFVGGWFLAMKAFKKQIKDNPVINEQQIKELYKTIGRKPSEKQIQQIMSNFKN